MQLLGRRDATVERKRNTELRRLLPILAGAGPCQCVGRWMLKANLVVGRAMISYRRRAIFGHRGERAKACWVGRRNVLDGDGSNRFTGNIWALLNWFTMTEWMNGSGVVHVRAGKKNIPEEAQKRSRRTCVASLWQTSRRESPSLRCRLGDSYKRKKVRDPFFFLSLTTIANHKRYLAWLDRQESCTYILPFLAVCNLCISPAFTTAYVCATSLSPGLDIFERPEWRTCYWTDTE